MPDLLFELFSEEIPARMQARACADLKKLVTDRMVEAGLTYSAAQAFATPRRLVLAVEGLPAQSPTVREERKGPRTDAPEKALEGFLRSTGLSRDALEVRPDKKGEVYFAVIEKAGRPAADVLAEVLPGVIRDFPWPKSMRWGTGSLRWVRPLHSILAILTDTEGTSVVPFEVDGIASGKTTRGHRFMAPDAFAVGGFDDYVAKLKKAFVVLDAEERAATIEADAKTLAFAAGLEVVEDAGLLREVSGLVEWPVTLMGEIGADFLDLPAEVLQTSMREHQKFFSVRDPKTGKIVRFITVANRATADDGATILKGNGKVLAARLADAKFFWDNDLRSIAAGGLEAMAGKLDAVTFHGKLGSQGDRIRRIEALAREIAPKVGAKPDLAAEAARVAKADLASEMVYEFPELQGVMGTYYARAAGHNDGVPEACAEHYAPLGPDDAVPTAQVSIAVALADKIDTLTGFWAIDEKPTGSKDPFALRRAALGVIRILVENGLRLPLGAAIGDRLDADGTADLTGFFHDRIKVWLRDRGIGHDVIDAVLAMPGADDLTLLVARAEALQAVLKTEDGGNLVQGFKRANNILTAEEKKDGVSFELDPDPKFAEHDAERALFAALDAAQGKIGAAIEAEKLADAMAAMADLRGPIDAFFEAVQVNAENSIVRRNRLCLLNRIRQVCGGVADLTRLEG